MRLSAGNLSIWYTANKLWAQIASWTCHAIWADLSRVHIHPRQDMPIANLSRHAFPEPRSVATIIYRHILLGENSFDLIRTRAHEKIQVDFFSRWAIICTVYCWEKCKKCKVTCTRGFFASIYCFIWIKCSWVNMVIGNCWQFS